MKRKIFCILIVFMLCILMTLNCVFSSDEISYGVPLKAAAVDNKDKYKDALSQKNDKGGEVELGLGSLDNYKPKSQTSEKFKAKAEIVLSAIRIIGTILSVYMLIMIGIKYMLGSVEEKADQKESIKAYLIGALLIFSGTTLPQILYEMSKNNNNV